MRDIENRIQREVPLAPYTTFRIGGPARFFIQPESALQFKAALRWALDSGIPCFVLGGGANILIHDSGYDGLIIHTGKLDRISIDEKQVRAECGVAVDDLVQRSLDHSLTGLEFAAGLPGTVGGALFMNARAYESEFSRVVERVYVLNVGKERVEEGLLNRDELDFSYKGSVFQHKKLYVYSVDFELCHGETGEIGTKIEQIRQKRRNAGQFSYPNAGCIFKNSYRTGKPTGQIIDELGLKGTRIGDAEIYCKHGNFIVNKGSATAQDVHRLILLIESEIRERLGVKIEREINLIGPWEELQGKKPEK
jgi:UDP-N-acetylmuramate dehydrogenase